MLLHNSNMISRTGLQSSAFLQSYSFPIPRLCRLISTQVPSAPSAASVHEKVSLILRPSFEPSAVSALSAAPILLAASRLAAQRSTARILAGPSDLPPRSQSQHRTQHSIDLSTSTAVSLQVIESHAAHAIFSNPVRRHRYQFSNAVIFHTIPRL